MISRIEGILEKAHDGTVELKCDHLVYTLLIPGADEQRLAAKTGEPMTFHVLQYLEGQGQGANFIPRMIGFSTTADRAFFEIFTTVKGIGNRKALRALQLPFGQVAEAIANRDLAILKSLPEIGKRTAETIVAELHGKVEQFIELDVTDPDNTSTSESSATAASSAMAEDAVAVLCSLGEQRLQAMQLVQRVLQVDGNIESTEQLIAAVYRLKELPA